MSSDQAPQLQPTPRQRAIMDHATPTERRLFNIWIIVSVLPSPFWVVIRAQHHVVPDWLMAGVLIIQFIALTISLALGFHIGKRIEWMRRSWGVRLCALGVVLVVIGCVLSALILFIWGDQLPDSGSALLAVLGPPLALLVLGATILIPGIFIAIVDQERERLRGKSMR